METVKLTHIGQGMGFVLPQEVVASLKSGEGDEFRITATADGITLQRVGDPAAEQLEAAQRVMTEDADVLNRLAQ